LPSTLTIQPYRPSLSQSPASRAGHSYTPITLAHGFWFNVQYSYGATLFHSDLTETLGTLSSLEVASSLEPSAPISWSLITADHFIPPPLTSLSLLLNFEIFFPLTSPSLDQSDLFSLYFIFLTLNPGSGKTPISSLNIQFISCPVSPPHTEHRSRSVVSDSLPPH